MCNSFTTTPTQKHMHTEKTKPFMNSNKGQGLKVIVNTRFKAWKYVYKLRTVYDITIPQQYPSGEVKTQYICY